MARTQKNKATERHMGGLKARLAKLRTELLTPKASVTGDGFDVVKYGDARVALIGFPSVGKSTLMSKLTGVHSEVAAYEFTTLTCIPGTIHHKDTKIQLLDLPGIIEGASMGRGRGRQVIAVAKSSDCILMVLDATKNEIQRALLEKELETCGIRINTQPPNITFRKTSGGGIKFNTTVPLTKCDESVVKTICQEYRIHNADVLFREDASVDQLIDVIEGNRKYIRCLYVYNKIDCITIEEVDEFARRPHSLVISCMDGILLNLDKLLEKIWEYMQLVRVYTKKRGNPPDFKEPCVLTMGRNGCTVESVCRHLHRDLVREFKYALVWGRSTKHSPQTCGLDHQLTDEDVIQVLKKSGKGSGFGKSQQATSGRVQKA